MQKVQNKKKNTARLSPFTDTCTCGNSALEYLKMVYPSGVEIHIPICKICLEEAITAIRKKRIDL